MADESRLDPLTASRQALVDGRPPIVYTHCRLSLTSGPDAGRSMQSEKDVIRIGSAPDNDFVVKDPAVSRSHLEIRKKTGEFTIADTGSTNGTFIGSLEIKEVTLRKRGEIQIGDSTLLFEPMSTEVVVEPSDARRCGEMVGESVAMRETFTVIQRVAQTELAILVTGETGTGKELVARAIHQLSKRKDGPFVTLAIGALPPTLIEDALFGHERGAVAGAEDVYAGAFERASGGTLFLDELAELPLSLQPRLLRALERGEIQRLRGDGTVRGSDGTVRVDVRVVAAAGSNIQQLVEQAKFRDDLYYRLAVIRIDLPPLAERREDVPALVEDFFARYGKDLEATGARAKRLSPGALAQLRNYDFPGNVRELMNILRRSVAVASGEEVMVTDLPQEITGKRPISGDQGPHAVVLPDASMPFKDAKEQVLDAFERQYLEDLLTRHRKNISKAAREAGIDRRHLYRLLDKYGIEVKDRPED